MKIDNANVAAFKYAEETKEKVITVCNPLFSLNIKVFAYLRIFNDGRHFFVGNNLELLGFCLQGTHDHRSSLIGKEIAHCTKDVYHCYIWPTQQRDYLLTGLYELDIWNGINMFKRREDGSVETWAFAVDRSAENVQSFYIENIELLQDFANFFNTKANDLLTPPTHYLATKGFTAQAAYFDNYQAKKIQEFIKATPIHKRPIIVNGEEIFLSIREAQCLNLLAAGKTEKQIALDLNASPRAVEKHLKNIRKKISTNDSERLIKTYKESVLNWL